jgi:hypothetical protein
MEHGYGCGLRASCGLTSFCTNRTHRPSPSSHPPKPRPLTLLPPFLCTVHLPGPDPKSLTPSTLNCTVHLPGPAHAAAHVARTARRAGGRAVRGARAGRPRAGHGACGAAGGGGSLPWGARQHPGRHQRRLGWAPSLCSACVCYFVAGCGCGVWEREPRVGWWGTVPQRCGSHGASIRCSTHGHANPLPPPTPFAVPGAAVCGLPHAQKAWTSGEGLRLGLRFWV